MEATYKIEGMTCSGCVGSVTKALQAAGVEVAEVSLEAHTARVKGTFTDDRIRQAVEKAGYDFVGRV
ncbi:MAG: heavy-metal-associated domain-containing protein [Myxococcota bacterium]